MAGGGTTRTTLIAAALACAFGLGAGGCGTPGTTSAAGSSTAGGAPSPMLTPSPSTSTMAVSTPPDDATPAEVVRAYADAVHAGDCMTAAALVARPENNWCGTIDITALRVTDQTRERRATESGDGPMIERVWVDLTVDGADVSMPDGDHQWSYLLDRVGPNGAWRIYDQGMG